MQISKCSITLVFEVISQSINQSISQSAQGMVFHYKLSILLSTLFSAFALIARSYRDCHLYGNEQTVGFKFHCHLLGYFRSSSPF